MNVILDVILLITCSLNIIIQIPGCYALLQIYTNGDDNVTHLYIMSLSFSELICSSLVCVVKLLIYNGMASVCEYILAFHYAAIALVYYLSMYFITIDKLLEVLLNIRLPVYWNIEKAKKLILATWLIGFLFGISSILSVAFASFDYERTLFHFFFPILDVSFILLSIPTYFFLFLRYRATQQPPSRKTSIQSTRRKASNQSTSGKASNQSTSGKASNQSTSE